jgi:predicted nucleic acid-binding protein
MIVYLDTGFFIDYFSKRSTVAVHLRTKSRRGRKIDQIQNESESIMNKSQSHKLITSVVTALEYSDNIYDTLRDLNKGLPDINVENVMNTKSGTAVFYKRCEKKNIRLVPLNGTILLNALRNSEYDDFTIYDAIHVQTARIIRANLIITTDSDLIKYDRAFDSIRILDTDDASKLL